MVLLRNEPVGGRPLLPLDGGATLSRLAVVGRLADLPNTGDHGSSDVRAPAVVTPLAGLRAALPEVEIVTPDADDPSGGAGAAGADAAIVVVGYTAEDEGEYVGSFDAEARHPVPAVGRPGRAGRARPGLGRRTAGRRRRPGLAAAPPAGRGS